MSTDENGVDADPLAKYEGFSDKQVYETLCEIHPALVEGFYQMAQMQAFMGYTDEMLLRAFRKDWPEGTRPLWEEGNEFRGRLLLRGVRYMAARMRAGLATAPMN